MSTLLTMESVPLEKRDDGVVCVSGTRVTLDSIVAAFERGATAEEVAQQYPTVGLSEVYAVIAYYLRNRGLVGKYMEERAEKAEAVRATHPLRLDTTGLRERLLARRAQ